MECRRDRRERSEGGRPRRPGLRHAPPEQRRGAEEGRVLEIVDGRYVNGGVVWCGHVPEPEREKLGSPRHPGPAQPVPRRPERRCGVIREPPTRQNTTLPAWE